MIPDCLYFIFARLCSLPLLDHIILLCSRNQGFLHVYAHVTDIVMMDVGFRSQVP
jgi:hypothetical protein